MFLLTWSSDDALRSRSVEIFIIKSGVVQRSDCGISYRDALISVWFGCSDSANQSEPVTLEVLHSFAGLS